ncbi:MAG TPA: OsmC family protein [Burkholderiales bacterium]|nr:OsmC family protein [Burkholderiales bacterium]
MSESVTLVQDKDFRFANTFGEGIPVLHADEAPPLGGGTGPTPIQLLAAAVGNCLAASLLFALRKFKNAPEPIRASVESQVGRNEENRLRVQRLKVRLDLGVPAGSLAHAERALAQFEDFCTVTASVRAAIPVDVEVYDAGGQRMK